MTEAEMLPLIDQAGFIFIGKVLAPRSKLSFTAISAADAVPVLISEILLSTDVMRGFKDKEVFVVSRNPSALTEGASLVFFTNILVLGDHVVVQEIGNVDAADRATSQIAQLANERPLEQRVSAADLIIIGQVLSCVPASHADALTVSEHDPQWWVARIAVQSIVKGEAQADIEALFASSTDIAWHKSPKLREGIRGVFSLHLLNASEAPPEVGRSIYLLIDPLDFLPAERLPDVQRLYSRTQARG